MTSESASCLTPFLKAVLGTLVDDGQFRELTHNSLAKLVRRLRAQMDRPCSPTTMMAVLNALSVYPEADHQDMAVCILKDCPELTACVIPAYLNKTTATLPFSLLVMEVSFTIEVVLSSLDTVISTTIDPTQPVTDLCERLIASAYDTARRYGYSPNSRHTPDWFTETKTAGYIINDAPDAYDDYRLSLWGSDGGYCPDD